MRDSVLSEHKWCTTLEQQGTDTLNFNRRWLSLIAELYGYQVTSLTTIGPEGDITGYLPLCAIQGAFRRQRLVALPFSDSCPLLAQDDATAHELIDQAIRLTQQREARYLELRTGVNDILAARPDLVAQNLYVRYYLPLDRDVDAMWSALRKQVQQKIKKSRKLGLQVRLAQTQDDVDCYYQMHLRTRSKKHGMPAQPRQFFQGLWNAFAAQGVMQVLLAEYEGIPIAGAVLLASGQTVRHAYGASDERYLYLAPNNLLMWTAMTWGGAQGFKILDLGRTARDNHGLMEFKRLLGGIEEPLPYYYHPRVAGLAATAESSWKTRALTACWKRLPLLLTEPVGGYLYKHLG